MSYKAGKSGSRGTRMLIGVLGAIVTLTPLMVGFSQAPSLYARAENHQKPEKAQFPVSCVFADKEYLEGTILQEKGGHQQLCVESFGKPLWVRMSPEMRERSRSVMDVPTPAPTFCVPKTSDSTKMCSCEEGIYSPGSIVNSARGLLACSAGKWNALKSHPAAEK